MISAVEVLMLELPTLDELSCRVPSPTVQITRDLARGFGKCPETQVIVKFTPYYGV